MSLTINTKTYEADAAVSANQIPYKGPGHNLSSKDKVDLFRTEPKGTPTFSGVGRARAKFVRTGTLSGAKTDTGDAIIDINVSVPVGASEVFMDALADDVGAFTSSPQFKLLMKNLDITH